MGGGLFDRFDRSDVIQFCIDKIKAKSYLEIGVDLGVNFNKIRCDFKVGVDPNPLFNASYCMSSDEFFFQNNDFFDVIFIDGLHHSDQVLRDINNSLNFLSPGGVIICHDMLPLNEEMQRVPFVSGAWTGDCWKSFVMLRQSRSDLEMFVVDCDFGCGIIMRGFQQTIVVDEVLNFVNFVKNKKEWLNIIGVDEFVKRFS